MAANNDIFSEEWCQLIFEKKNLDYGAFELRHNSSKRQFWAFVIASVFFVFGVLLPVLIKQIIPEAKEKDVSVRMMTDIKLDKPKENNILKELPPPPPPLLRNTVKFTPPVIKPDEMVQEEEQPISQKEAVETKSAISNVTYKDSDYRGRKTICHCGANASISRWREGDDEVYQKQSPIPFYGYRNGNIGHCNFKLCGR